MADQSSDRALPNSSNLGWIFGTLTAGAVLELLIYRTFSRVGVFIPKDSDKMATFRTVYNVSVQIGTIILNFAVVLAVISLVMSIARFRLGGEFGALAVANSRLGQDGRRRNILLSIALVAAIVVIVASAALLWLVQNELTTTVLRVALLVAFSALAADMWLKHREWYWRLFIGLMLGGYYLQVLAKLLHSTILPWLGISLSEEIYLPMLDLGELLVLVNGFVAFVCFVRVRPQRAVPQEEFVGGRSAVRYSLFREIGRHWGALVAAVVLVGAFLGLTFTTVAESYIVPILGLYGLGYAMHWPLWLYALALFFILYTIFYSLGRGKAQRAVAMGLILILVGGYTFNISEQYLFALVGVLLLARPELLEIDD